MTDECIYPKCLVHGTERTFRGSQCVCEARGQSQVTGVTGATGYAPMPHDAPIGPDPVRGTWHNLTPPPEGFVHVGSLMGRTEYAKLAPSDEPKWNDCQGFSGAARRMIAARNKKLADRDPVAQVDEYQKIADRNFRPRADNPSGFRLSDGTDISRMTADQINAHMRSPKFPTAEENRRQLHRARCLWVRGVLFAVGAVCAVAAVTGAHDSEVFKIGLSGLGAAALGLLILRFCVEDNSNEAR